jgi:carbonic anhydrase/acetyltransferase-like protein (isoleucine patch superfamily)
MLYRFDGKEPTIGSGTYVSETALVIGDIAIGNDCYIGHGAILRGDYGRIEIGDGAAVEEGVIIHAPPEDICSIGQGVIIGHGAIIHSQSIGNWAAIGMGAILSIRSKVGSKSIVAEGAIVRQNQKITESVMAAGNPAKQLRKVSHTEGEYWDWARKLYVNLAHKYCNLGMEKVNR